MDFIVKNRSKLTMIDIMKLECQNRMSEIFYQYLNPLLLKINQPKLEQFSNNTSNSNNNLYPTGNN